MMGYQPTAPIYDNNQMMRQVLHNSACRQIDEEIGIAAGIQTPEVTP